MAKVESKCIIIKVRKSLTGRVAEDRLPGSGKIEESPRTQPPLIPCEI